MNIYNQRGKNFFRILKILGIFFVFSSPLRAAVPKHYHEPKIVQHNGFWPMINVQNYLSNDHRWAYLLNSQARFLNETHPLKTVLIQDSIGYSINQNLRIWMGYYYSGHNFQAKYFTENRLFQELYWKIVSNQKTKVAYRTRLEENQFNIYRQNQVLLRQLLAKEFLTNYKGMLNPLIYDEMFFRVNKPSYASHDLISQNRLFLGFNLNTTDHSFWRIGYLNQYATSTPVSRTAMNHIFVISYTVGVPNISLPIDS